MLDRAGIAKEIEIINRLNPAVVAVDLQFIGPSNTLNDSLLELTLGNCKKLVMTSALVDYQGGDNVNYKIKSATEKRFLKNAQTGFANVILEDDESQTLKRFSTWENVGDKKELHFAVQIVKSFDEKTANLFLEGPKVVDIKFSGNIDRFDIRSAQDALQNRISEEDVSGKIVLLGSVFTFDDLFITGFQNSAGKKSTMCGVLVIANEVLQILDCQD